MARAWRRHGRFPALSGARLIASVSTLGRDTASPAPEAGHEPSLSAVTERDSFAHGYCLCGWNGPGRRARASATSDVELHRLVCPLARSGDATPAAELVSQPGNIPAVAGVDPPVHRSAVAPGPN